MGQQLCSMCRDGQAYQRLPKSSLYTQELLTRYTLPEKESQLLRHDMSQSYLSVVKNLPSSVIDLLMALNMSKIKYSDPYFPQENFSITTKLFSKKQKWVRLGERDKYQISKKQLGYNQESQSKLITILKIIDKNYPSLCEKIKPKFEKRAGIAICDLYINGAKEEVLIDDFIPLSFLHFEIPSWMLLLEKAFAKVLGCYQYTQAFTMGEMFCELAGIPYYRTSTKKSEKSEIHGLTSFKDALKCDELQYQRAKLSNDSSVLGYRNGFTVSWIKFWCEKRKNQIFRFQIEQNQIISIRLNQLNKKYQEEIDSPFYEENIIFILMRELENNQLQVVGQKYHFQNYIYVDGVFTELEEGTYWVYVKSINKSEKFSLTTYSKKAIKITQIFNQKECHSFLQKKIILNSECTEILPGLIGTKKIFTNLMILRLNKIPKKKVLRLKQSQCWFENDTSGKKRILAFDQSAQHTIVIFWSGEQMNIEDLIEVQSQ